MRYALLAGILLPAMAVYGQDALKAAPKNFKVLTENAHVRVVQDTLAPGEAEPMHTHPAGWYYVTQPGTMRITDAHGKTTTWEAKAGEQAWMEAEGPHRSENVGKTVLQYVLVEVKSAGSTH